MKTEKNTEPVAAGAEPAAEIRAADVAAGAAAQDSAAPERTAAPQEHADGEARNRRFPTATDFLVFLGLFFVANLVGAGAALLAGFPWPDTVSGDVASQGAVAEFNAVSYSVSMSLTLIAMLVYRARRGGPRRVARFSRRGTDPVLLLWGVVFMSATSVVLEPLLSLLPEVPSAAYGRGVWAAVTLVVMAPLFEELIFRGVLLESMRRRYGLLAAWLLSSLLFAVVHLHPTVAVNAFFMGLILGFVYIASDSLWASVFLHAVNNGIAYVLLLTGIGGEGMLLGDLIASETLYGVIYTVAAAIFLLSGFMMLRTLRRLNARR